MSKDNGNETVREQEVAKARKAIGLEQEQFDLLARYADVLRRGAALSRFALEQLMEGDFLKHKPDCNAVWSQAYEDRPVLTCSCGLDQQVLMAHYAIGLVREAEDGLSLVSKVP